MEDGVLMVYYSKLFPKFAQQVRQLEQRDTVLASSFVRRYEIWLVVHSFLLFQAEQEQEGEADLSDEQIEEQERKERLRTATLAVLFATKEIQQVESVNRDDE